MASLPRILFETLLISVGRVSLFYACRHYLLRSLYHDLRHLSSSSEPSLGTGLPPTPLTEDTPRLSETELDQLPAPSTTPRTPSSNFPSGPNQHNTERTWHSSLSRATFSLCFSESCTLFLLVLSQATNLFSQRARYVNWRISLGLLVSTILLISPLLVCLLLTYRAPSKAPTRQRRPLSTHFLLTGLPYGMYLLVLSYIPLPSRLESSELTTATLSRLVVLGTLILGMLAGFGATSAVFTHIQLLLANRQPVSDSEIVAAEQALFRVRSDLLDRKRQVETSTASEPDAQGGFLSRFNPFSGDPEITSIKREIQGLEALELQMSRNVEFLKRRRAATRFSSTIRGHVWMWGGRFFALYCAFRVISSILSLLSPFSSTNGPTSTPSSPDLLAQLLARFVSLFLPVSEEDIAATSRQLSFLLVGAIILSSVRRALRGVVRMLKLTSKNLAASLLLLILAQLMGTYLLSTLIQLRTSFPAPTSDTEDKLNLFATLPEYHVFGPLWDGAFLASVGASGAVRWFDERVNGPGLG